MLRFLLGNQIEANMASYFGSDSQLHHQAWWIRDQPRSWICATGPNDERTVEQWLSFLIPYLKGVQPTERIVHLRSSPGHNIPSLESLAKEKRVFSEEAINNITCLYVPPFENEELLYSLTRLAHVVVFDQQVFLSYPSLFSRLKMVRTFCIATLTSELNIKTCIHPNPEHKVQVHKDCNLANPVREEEGKGHPQIFHCRYHIQCSCAKVQLRNLKLSDTKHSTRCIRCDKPLFPSSTPPPPLPLNTENVHTIVDIPLSKQIYQKRKEKLIKVLCEGEHADARFCVFKSYRDGLVERGGVKFYNEFTKISEYTRSDIVRPYIESWDSMIRTLKDHEFCALPLPGDGGMGAEKVDIFCHGRMGVNIKGANRNQYLSLK